MLETLNAQVEMPKETGGIVEPCPYTRLIADEAISIIVGKATLAEKSQSIPQAWRDLFYCT